MARYTGFGTDRENLIAALDVVTLSAISGDGDKVAAAMRKLSNEEPGPRVFTLACTMLRLAILDLTDDGPCMCVGCVQDRNATI